MTLPHDSKEFIALLNAAGAEYLIIGGHAMAYYSLPRSTGDVDFFVGTSSQNAEKICHVIQKFGFASLGCKPEDFTAPDNIVQLGFAPNRIDILTSIDGVDFGEAWRDRVSTVWEGVPVNLISRAHLIANKRATGRPQDLGDVDRLEQQ